MAANIIGVDIGTYATKALALKVRSGQTELVGLGLARTPKGLIREGLTPAVTETLSEVIRTLLDSAGLLGGGGVAAAVGGPDTAVLNISIPITSPSRLDAAVATEAAYQWPFPLEQAGLSYHILHKSPQTGFMDILVAAADHKLIENYRDLFKTARLKLQILDVQPLAVFNAFDFIHPSYKRNVLLLDIGANWVTMMILKNGRPFLACQEQSGAQRLTDVFQEIFRLSRYDAEAVKFGAEAAPDPGRAVEEARKLITVWLETLEKHLAAIRLEHGDFSLDSVFLSGGGALLPGLPEELGRILRLPVSLLNPLDKMTFNSRHFDPAYLSQVGPQMVQAFGLALRKAEER